MDIEEDIDEISRRLRDVHDEVTRFAAAAAAAPPPRDNLGHLCDEITHLSAHVDTIGADEPIASRCPICLTGIRNLHETPCNHVFCADCLAEALRRSDTCPICRRPSVHTCDAFDSQCMLCIAGHVPGVVTPNFAEEMSRGQCLILVFKIIALTLCEIAAGWLCVIGYVPFEIFCAQVALIFTLKCWLVLPSYPGFHTFQRRVRQRLAHRFEAPIAAFG